MPPKKQSLPPSNSLEENVSELRNGKKRLPFEPSKKRGGGHGGNHDNKPLVEYSAYVSSSSEDEDEEMTGQPVRSKPIPIAPRRQRPIAQKMVDEDDEEEEDDTSDSDFEGSATNTIIPPGASFQINIGSFDESDNPMIPKRHNLKKEPALVKKFVELVTKPIEDVGIDAQIDYFKTMDNDYQNQLINALERRPTATDSGAQLMFRILTMKIHPDMQAMALAKYQSLQSMDTSSSEYYKQRAWLDKFCSMPFGMYKELPVTLERDGPEVCSSFLQRSKSCLDAAVFGQDEAKLQVLQWMANKVANPTACGKSLLLVGDAGVGKTSLIKEGIAKAIDWPFQFISLGGDSDASTYTGHQLVYESSHVGKIASSLIAAKSMSMILMFDEVDKISSTPKGEEVQNLLVHLTDPVQNSHFEDKYLAGIPIDLSKVMFIFSANNISKIDKILLDRMNVIHMKTYSSKEKLVIAENYLLPTALAEVSLQERVSIPKDVLQYIIEHYTATSSGVRELKRCIESIVQKINMLRMYNSKELPFFVKDFTLPFVVKREHVELFLKKSKPASDDIPFGMYV